LKIKPGTFGVTELIEDTGLSSMGILAVMEILAIL